jgi:hypothetical protein
VNHQLERETMTMRKPIFTRPLLGFCALLALGAALACGASVDPLSGSETHFLARCSAECGGGLECIDGVCTRPCVDDAECTSLSSVARCAPSETASGADSCRVDCSGNDDCRAQNDDWTCATASCVGSPAFLSGSGPIGTRRCPTFAGGVQEPSEIQTTFERVPGSANVEWAYADESGVYWIDFDGGIFGVRKGAASPTTLRPAPSTPGTRLGLIGDANRLYWTEASAVPPGPPELGPPPPPGRLMTISKDGGAAELILESASLVLTPAGVDASGRVFVNSADGYLNEVSASGLLEPVANIPRIEGGGLQMVDGQAYWLEYEEGDGMTRLALFAATPGAAAPLRLTFLEGDTGVFPFVVGRGVVLWTTGETRFNPLLLVQHYMMLNENTGCVQALPSVELSIGQSLVDDRHVYWQSFNSLGSATPGQTFDLAPVLRVDLRTGRFEHVAIPGLDVSVISDLVAQDDTTIYVRQSPEESLFAVRKPD